MTARFATRFFAPLAALCIVAGCSTNANPDVAQATTTTPATTQAAATTSSVVAATSLVTSTTAPARTTTTLALFATDVAPNGRAAPRVAATAPGLAAQIVGTEQALRAPTTPSASRPDLGHLNQLAYRALSTKPEWDAEVLRLVPDELRPIVTAHVRARREFLAMRETLGDTVPDWEIRQPATADTLLSFYREAQSATGVGWQYLAAINLVESGLGRINGLSTAGAIGPMQFLQSTWNERGIGQGDIRDPHDSIQAAARYLVRRGAPADMAKALLGYNNHPNYVRAVTAYAELFAADEQSFRAAYEWEIYYLSAIGDIWLPVGYRQTTKVPVATFVASAPWSAPPPGAFIPPRPK